MANDEKMHPEKGSVPSPDPTVLTTQGLMREIGGLKELLITRMECQEENITHIREHLNERGLAIAAGVGHLQVLHQEKFEGIEKQFKERDVRTEQAAIATKIAVDAALQAQKEAAGAQNESNAAAIAKSEAATTKQIDGIIALLNGGMKALDEKIVDLKGRIDRGDGKSTGHGETWGYIVAGIVVLGILIDIIIKVTVH